jgi:hypothetical protein
LLCFFPTLLFKVFFPLFFCTFFSFNFFLSPRCLDTTRRAVPFCTKNENTWVGMGDETEIYTSYQRRLVFFMLCRYHYYLRLLCSHFFGFIRAAFSRGLICSRRIHSFLSSILFLNSSSPSKFLLTETSPRSDFLSALDLDLFLSLRGGRVERSQKNLGTCVIRNSIIVLLIY